MCGRIALYTQPERIARRFHAALAPDLGDAGLPHWNVPPTQPVLALVHPRPRREERAAGDKKSEADATSGASSGGAETEDPGLVLAPFRWGLIPWWAKDISIGSRQFNARAETLENRRAFRQALESRRCLVVADGFYEWKRSADSKRKTPFYFTRSDGSPLTFAGLWDRWRDPALGKDAPKVHSCTIITTCSGPDVEAVHDRMPVVVEPDEVDTWLVWGQLDQMEMAHILRPSPAGTLRAQVVSAAVNSVKNDSPDLIESVPPLREPAQQALDLH